MRKKYNTEEERIAAIKESFRKFKERNPDYFKESMKKWYEDNKDDFNAYYKEWIKEKRKKDPILARAQRICDSYRTNDKKYNRGKCTLTAKWIAKNIFPKPCFYCGETGWEIIGCDRINIDLPHTPDNVVPCCKPCNIKRGTKPFEEFCKEMGVEPIIIAEQTII